VFTAGYEVGFKQNGLRFDLEGQDSINSVDSITISISRPISTSSSSSSSSSSSTGGFGGLEVACWPLVHKFAGSNPAEDSDFSGEKKTSARLPSEGK
jgi:hypothetical protein